MKLSTYISHINQTYTEAMGTQNNQAMEQGLRNGLEVIMGKQIGQSISGEVLMRDHNDVLILLGKNQLLQAKLDGNISAQPGQLLTFLIKNNSGNKVVLSPLFENTNQNPSISKAISASGLPHTDTVINMVKTMMEEGLPIDKQSLYQMNKLINQYPKADITNLVQMHRLQLPINDDTIFQFGAYKNYQHHLGEGLMDIADSLSQASAQLISNSTASDGLSFYSQILELFTDESFGENEIIQYKSSDAEIMRPMTGEQLFSETLVKELSQYLRSTGFSEDLVQTILQKPINSREFFQQVRLLMQSPDLDQPTQEKLLELFDSKSFKNILKNEIQKQWLLQPEEVATENSIDKLYERLNSQMKRLNQLLAETTKADTPLARTVSQVSGNIDFMNQLNQVFTYVQLPLKMQGHEATGELFVYTNKKNMAKEDGILSALLHLDMEHLGSVDVHVKLDANHNVSTKFYLQDDSSLDLIARNIQMLNDRLAKRGYTMHAEFLQAEDSKNVMEEMLLQNKNISILTGHSFDAKA